MYKTAQGLCTFQEGHAKNGTRKKDLFKKELSFARKQEIEKRLDKPSMQTRIKRMARKMFKDVRKKEVERKKG